MKWTSGFGVGLQTQAFCCGHLEFLLRFRNFYVTFWHKSKQSRREQVRAKRSRKLSHHHGEPRQNSRNSIPHQRPCKSRLHHSRQGPPRNPAHQRGAPRAPQKGAEDPNPGRLLEPLRQVFLPLQSPAERGKRQAPEALLLHGAPVQQVHVKRKRKRGRSTKSLCCFAGCSGSFSCCSFSPVSCSCTPPTCTLSKAPVTWATRKFFWTRSAF